MAAFIRQLIIAALLVYTCSAFNQTVLTRYYPRYHFAPPQAWMNDPNGFCKFGDWYHIFYQHNPTTSLNTGNIHWGHAKSLDLFHWIHLPIALYPNSSYDRDGVYSGSAYIENDTMYLYYTGNLDTPNQQYQALATSTDGINFEKYENNPILIGAEYQPEIRDPQVWKHEDTYYMVLGNSYNTTCNTTLGRVLLYTSKDRLNWSEGTVLAESNGTLGYMWECPVFFEIEGHWVLMFSPQGVPKQGDLYNNIYQTGYFIGDFDFTTKKYTITKDFREMDCGHDFYATQFVKIDGSIVVIAWFDVWEQVYPERADGFAGTFVLPRNLTLGKDGILYQKPVNTIYNAIGENLYSEKGVPGSTVELPDKTAEIRIKAPADKDFTLYIESENQTIVLSFDARESKVTLDRGGEDGVRRRAWKPDGALGWRVFVDASSCEVFCEPGDITFSSRYFPSHPVKVRLGEKSYADQFIVNSMKRTMPEPGNAA